MYRKLPFRLLTSSHLVAFTENEFLVSSQYTCAAMIKNMDTTRIPCTPCSNPGDIVVSKRLLTFVLSENDRRYLFL